MMPAKTRRYSCFLMPMSWLSLFSMWKAITPIYDRTQGSSSAAMDYVVNITEENVSSERATVGVRVFMHLKKWKPPTDEIRRLVLFFSISMTLINVFNRTMEHVNSNHRPRTRDCRHALCPCRKYVETCPAFNRRTTRFVSSCRPCAAIRGSILSAHFNAQHSRSVPEQRE